jgi:hypothetical protein
MVLNITKLSDMDYRRQELVCQLGNLLVIY